MDYEWGTRDNQLGEAILDINSYIGGTVFQQPLMRNGKPESGSIFFSMVLDTQEQFDRYGNRMQGVKLNIHKAIGLRKAEWFGKNDVYVQAYALPAGSVVTGGKPLPDPVIKITLPAGTVTIPFEFSLPADLPSSFVLDDHNYIIYSIYANIDVAWKSDPSTRCFFTVMQPNPACMYMNPVMQQGFSRVILTEAMCGCIGAPEIGSMTIKAWLDRGAYDERWQ
jgi:hypothetical protein